MNRRKFSLALAGVGAAGSQQRPRPSYISRVGKDESPLELTRTLADKYINSSRDVYPPNKKTDRFYRWHYPTGVALWALCQLSDISNESTYLDFVRRSFDYYIDENNKQFFNYTIRLQDPAVKLYYQGWGWGTNRTTHSPGFWSRGNGWVLMAMTEVLKTVPSGHAGWSKLLDVYRDFAAAVLKAQGEGGMWHQLMTRHDSYEETSGTAMFIYSFLHGHKSGWLTAEFRDSALRGFAGVKRMIDVDGNIYNTCIGTGTQNTLEDYYQRETPVNDHHGIGPVLLAGCAVSSIA